ncbi:MAG: type II toxin-antitoxin system VapC family toxin [Cyanobacteria bacterium J06621_8]
MNLLLDTHIFLWFINDNPRLSDRITDLIENENNVCHLSIASLWEMSIKYNLGKLTLKPNYDEFIQQEVVASSIQLLNIELEHLKINATLPFHHRDPFDRLIIAQSIAENIPIISLDSAFDKYSVTIINE